MFLNRTFTILEIFLCFVTHFRISRNVSAFLRDFSFIEIFRGFFRMHLRIFRNVSVVLKCNFVFFKHFSPKGLVF